jgi:hypothetical protein
MTACSRVRTCDAGFAPPLAVMACALLGAQRRARGGLACPAGGQQRSGHGDDEARDGEQRELLAGTVEETPAANRRSAC